MDESDSLALCADSRSFVDQPHPGVATAFECRIEIVDRKADVMYAGATAPDELPHRSVVSVIRLEELNQTVSRSESDNPRAVRIGDLRILQLQYFTKEWQHLDDRLQGDSNVRNTRAFRGSILH